MSLKRVCKSYCNIPGKNSENMSQKNIVKIESVTKTNMIKHLKINITEFKQPTELTKPIKTTTPSSKLAKTLKFQPNQNNMEILSNRSKSAKSQISDHSEHSKPTSKVTWGDNVWSKNTAEVAELMKDVPEVKSEWMESVSNLKNKFILTTFREHLVTSYPYQSIAQDIQIRKAWC